MLQNVHLASESMNMSSEVEEEGMQSNGNVGNTKQHHDHPSPLTGKNLSCQNLTRNDSLDMESRSFPKPFRVHIHIPFFSFHFQLS